MVVKHGMERSPEYRVWTNMRQRCQNPNHNSYKHYGAQGIEVCDKWEDFSSFYADMGPRPSQHHSIDRIDNEGNYEPSNCHWATRLDQANNTSWNRLVKYQGKEMTITQAIRMSGSIVTKTAVLKRLKMGWHIRRAVETPPDMKRLLKKSSKSKASWDWRSNLTKEEADLIAASDKAMEEIDRAREEYSKIFGRDRAMIVNRAIQRAKHDFKKGKS